MKLTCYLLSLQLVLCSSALKDAFRSVSKERFLVLSFEESIKLPQKMLAVASSAVLATLSNRTLLINDSQPLMFFDPELSIDDVQLDPQTVNNTLTDPIAILKFLGCNLEGQLKDEYTLFLTSNEFFLPALFLNNFLKAKLSELLPTEGIFKYIVEQLFSFPEQLEKAVEKRYKHAIDFYGKGEIIGVVLDPPESTTSNFADVRLVHKCVPRIRDSIIHVISTLPQLNRKLQEHFPKFLFNKSTDTEFGILVELLFQARYASQLLLYQNSPLSHVVQALANKPAIYLKSAHSEECYLIDKPEPCYAHSMKQLFQACGETMGIEFNSHDLISYPDNIDSCKDAKIGIKVKNPNDQ